MRYLHTNAFKVIDAKRVWDATFDAVKAANSAEGFSGEDGEIVLKFQSKGGSSVHNSDIPEFDLEGIFRDLADQDYDRAVELAPGEFLIVPRGTEHRTAAEEETEVVLFEPAATRNTGDISDDRLTAPGGVKI